MCIFRTAVLSIVLLSGFCAACDGNDKSDSRDRRAAVLANGNTKTQVIDFVDPTYRGRICQVYNPNGDEHNLYHYRTPFNSDNSSLLGIETPHGTKQYQVTLYDGDGRFLKKLFTVPEYDWRVVWDRKDPHIFYTWRKTALYRYDVQWNKAELLRSFEPLSLKPAGPSFNQIGDRILVVTADNVVHTFRLPDMDDERLCHIDMPEGYYAGWDKLRLIGYRDYFAVTFFERGPFPQGGKPKPPFTRIYDAATGKVFHTLEGISIGHGDFSPDGKLAYVKLNPRQGRAGRRRPRPGVQARVVNIDGRDDHAVYELSGDALRYVRNYHITWPDNVNDWFAMSFFPQTGHLPAEYKPPLDELMQIRTDGTVKILGRTGTTCAKNFWAQPQQSPSADGSRILFHTNGTCQVGKLGYESSGTIDLCILYLK